MDKNLKLAWIASLFALVGQVVYFFGVSLYTGNWSYLMWSIFVSMVVGVPSIIRTWQAQKKVNSGKVNSI